MKRENPYKYYYFTGQPNNNIFIKNENGLLDFTADIYILLYIHLVDLKFLEKFDKLSLMKVKLTNETTLEINISSSSTDAKLNEICLSCSSFSSHYDKVLIKMSKSSKIDISINDNPKEYPNLIFNEQIIESITLFDSFIGTCSNIIIYKSNKEGIYFPEFLSKEMYKYGLFKEALFAEIAQSNIINESEDKLFIDHNLANISGKNLSPIRNFLDFNLIAIYIPTRYENTNDGKTIILEDSIHSLNAILNNESNLAGIHAMDNIFNGLYQIGGPNHLLPIIELFIKEPDLATEKTFNKFMDVVALVFSHLVAIFRMSDRKTMFFSILSQFLEKLPDNLYTAHLSNKLKDISSVLSNYKDDDNFLVINQQFIEYILLNQKILLKFPFSIQKDFINQIVEFINSKSKTKATIKIIEIINILLFYDSQRYKKYCCKRHRDYFLYSNNNEIMSPELNDIIEPIFKLIKELFNKYILQFKVVKDIKFINDYNIDKLFDLLTIDISPCLQKNILSIFYRLKSEQKEVILKLNKNRKFIFILLYLIKTSIFDDIKLLAFNFAMLLSDDKFLGSENNPTLVATNKKIRKYIEFNILPYSLIDEDNEPNLNEILKDIPEEITIEDLNLKKAIKCRYLIPSKEEKLLYKKYNKDKIDEFLNTLFEKIYNYFNAAVGVKINLNILVKIASKANIFISLKLLDKMKEELDSKNNNYEQKHREIYSNRDFLHWLLETCFRSYLLRDKMKKKEEDKFNCGIIFQKNTAENEKLLYVDKLFDKSYNLLMTIFKVNIFKLDYLMSWAKYYFEINREETLFYKIRDFLNEYFFQKLITNTKVIRVPQISQTYEQKAAVYLYNIIFEYYTYFRIIPTLNNFDITDEETLYQEVSIPFKHNVYTEVKKEYKEEFSEDKFTKTQFYTNMKKMLSLFQSVWIDGNKKVINDKNFYDNFLHHKENVFLNDLELLFYNFEDIQELKLPSSSNKGMPLIFVLFHQFTLFLTYITDKNEFKEILENFRELITLLIVSSSTVTIAKGKGNTPSKNSTIKGESYRINWPNEKQYKDMQFTIKNLIFSCFHFFYFKVLEINESIKKYQNDKDRMEFLTYQKNYFYDTISFFLKLLNNILKERQRREDNKKKSSVKSFFRSIKHKIVTKLDKINFTGSYQFIYELFEQCFKPEGNITDMVVYILNKMTFMDEIPDLNIDDFSKGTGNYSSKIYPKIDATGNMFMTDKNINKYLNLNFYKNQKILFPFTKYILTRRVVVKNIIPIYNNYQYCKQKYNTICLIPFYYPLSSCHDDIITNTEKTNKLLTKEIRLDEITRKMDKYDKIYKYYKMKKKLFTFNGIWSKKEFFYDQNKFQLKYKLLNHLTEDYVKIFLTPIIDIDSYLPTFSCFDTNELFRENKEIFSLEKIADLSSELFSQKMEKENKKKLEKEIDKIEDEEEMEEDEPKEEDKKEKEEDKKEEDKKEEEKKKDENKINEDNSDEEKKNIEL